MNCISDQKMSLQRLKYAPNEFQIIYSIKIYETVLSSVYMAKIYNFNMPIVAKINKDRNHALHELNNFIMLNKGSHELFPRLMGYSDDGTSLILLIEAGAYSLAFFTTSFKEVVTIERKYSIALQISQALSFIHSIGYVHCDIKLGNILMFNFGIIKLIDFGSMTKQDTKIKVSKFGFTKQYLPPQFYNSDDETEHKITTTLDIYAFGLILSVLLLGTKNVCIDRNFRGNNIPVCTLTNKLDETCLLSGICASCLMYEEKYRPLDGNELFSRLKDACKKQCPSYYINFFETEIPGKTKDIKEEFLKICSELDRERANQTPEISNIGETIPECSDFTKAETDVTDFSDTDSNHTTVHPE